MVEKGRGVNSERERGEKVSLGGGGGGGGRRGQCRGRGQEDEREPCLALGPKEMGEAPGGAPSTF